MSLKDKEKWNNKYEGSPSLGGTEPSEWLSVNADLLSGSGRALDIAAGEGRNAVYAASLGYDVLAVDISEVGLARARDLANKKNINITTLIADLDNYDIESEAFNLILCFNFLDRRLFPKIRNAIKPGGFLFYETFNVDYLKYSSFKKEWVLDYNELLTVFADYRIWRYQEIDREEKGLASLVAQKQND